MLLFVWYKIYINLFLSVCLLPPCHNREPKQGGMGFPFSDPTDSFPLCSVCLHCERSWASGVETVALEESLNLSEPLFLHSLLKNSNNNENNRTFCVVQRNVEALKKYN